MNFKLILFIPIFVPNNAFTKKKYFFTVHVIGLHLYNSPGASLYERLVEVKRTYSKTAFMRICRILPAFGIAGVLNNWLRECGEQVFLDENLWLDELAHAAETEDEMFQEKEKNTIRRTISQRKSLA